ncbi:MAG TPA: RHS repeat domain-containing protein [Kofleriaceae bacterium]
MLLWLMVAGCARPLAPDEWRETVPDAPCDVNIVNIDGMGAFERVARYDAAGHIIFGTTQLTYDGRGREYFRWDGPRLVHVDSYYDQDARRGDCDVEGGCDEPATRTIDEMTLRYDGARLVGTDRTTLVFERDNRGAYVSSDRRHDREAMAYDGERLVGFRGTIRWAGGHPVERRNGTFDDTFEWHGDRLAAYRWASYLQTFAYDSLGRLANETLTGGAEHTTTAWSYDSTGRLVSRTEDGSDGRHEWTWRYDDAGRVVRFTNGGATTDYAYGASCPAHLNAPITPTALARAKLVVCAQSPGDLYDTCE